MRRGLLLVAVLWPWWAFNQSFAEEMQRCAEEFHTRFGQSSSQGVLDVYKALGTCVEGHRLPDFEVTDLQGITYKPADWSGKVVWINFWFIACPPCQAELPMIEALYQQYKDREDFVLLTFAVDKPGPLVNFAEKKNLHYPIVAESESFIQDTLHMTFDFFPTNIFLDKEGKIIKYKPGGPIDAAGIQRVGEEFKTIIEAELKNQP